jgi:pimeloyl-ACP methyl ester carboxylesterase
MKRTVLICAAGLAAALAAVMVLGIPWMATHPHRFPVSETPAKVGLAYDDVAFPSARGRLTIRGWWIPAPRPRAVVILVHGDNTNRRDVYGRGLELARFLAGRNVSVLMPDLRNFGESDASPSGMVALGYDEAGDVVGAVDQASRRAPGLPIYVMGNSLGGATAIYAAAADHRIRGLILYDPILDNESVARNMLHAMAPVPMWALEPTLWSTKALLGDVMAHSPLAVAARLETPMLLIQDDGDHICNATYAYQLARRNPAVRLWVSHDPPVDGASLWVGFAGHVAAYKLHPTDVEQQLRAFLRS